VQCIITYLEKDPTVAESCITMMLKYWPVTNPTKEIIFLNELEEVTSNSYSFV
jgi:serine/threonine-protein phosphatase 2A regulatory subunit B'